MWVEGNPLSPERKKFLTWQELDIELFHFCRVLELAAHSEPSD